MSSLSHVFARLRALPDGARGHEALRRGLGGTAVLGSSGFTLSQLGILISTPLGIWWLHETRTRKELRWTLIGVALVIVGAVLAGVAKTLDVA